MLNKEITEYIDSLSIRNYTKLQIIQEIISLYGSQYPSFSFKKWSESIATYIDTRASVTPEPASVEYTVLPNSQCNSHKIEPNSYSTNINLDALNASGYYNAVFRDKFILSKPNLLDLFKLFVLHVGASRIKELNINIHNCDLISYNRKYDNKLTQYPLYSSCYLFVRISEQEASEIIFSICQKLSIPLVLRKGETNIFSTVSQNSSQDETASVEHSDSNKNTESLSKSSEYFMELIANMRTASIKGDKAPHKPILLLSVIELMRLGIISQNIIYFNDSLISKFQEFWSLYVPSNSPFNPDCANPYIHMSTSPFWHIKLSYSPSSLMIANNYWIKKNVEYAFLDEDLYKILQSSENRTLLCQFIKNNFKLFQKGHPDASTDAIVTDKHTVLHIMNYKNNRIAIYGDTRPYKDYFKSLEARFAPSILDGTAWLLPKQYESEIRKHFGSLIQN
jgi:hypothetical protein